MWSRAVLVPLEQAFARLSADVALLAPDGTCLTDDRPMAELPERMADGEVVQKNGRLLMQVKMNDPVVLSVSDDRNALDVLRLAESLVQLALRPAESVGLDGVYRRILKGDLPAAFLPSVAEEQGIEFDRRRCVILFYVPRPGTAPVYSQIREYLPIGDDDVLVEMDVHTAALVKDVPSVEEQLAISQYADACWETLNGELGMNLYIGVSDIHAHLSSMECAYREATQSFEVGRAYKPDGHVYVFRHLMLERLLSEMDPEMCARYHSLLFNRKTARLFSDEMLHTIEMFFQKDLNLSDTSRQLFIHRNTLVYRLDKVQSQIGLDLRRFEDAVTFKVLMDLKRKGVDHARSYDVKGGIDS